MNRDPTQTHSNSPVETAPTVDHEASAVRKPSLLRRLARRGFDSVEGQSEIDPAPLGYTDTGEPKKIQRVTVIDPDGDKPPVSYKVRNW